MNLSTSGRGGCTSRILTSFMLVSINQVEKIVRVKDIVLLLGNGQEAFLCFPETRTLESHCLTDPLLYSIVEDGGEDLLNFASGVCYLVVLIGGHSDEASHACPEW
mmetsp:Transcript_14242/g.40304  ORF Transcript_14242/g.40304 Transcript_14242/m.40304 type:complete len:106 (-) Transcript_14242:513-830(-)